jgi:ATP-dependent helicase/nuclease subunit A
MGQRAAQRTTAELISALWYAEGYRYETEWNTQTVVYRELYDYLFAIAAKADADGLSLAAFTDKLRGYQENGSRLEDMDIPLERSGAVRLMTIHKSKGLEFPVVFLCCCGSRGKNSGNDDEVYRTEDGGISCNPPLPPECADMDKVKRNFFYEQGRAVEKRKKTAELRRLLYVAMTRAEKELFITGGISLDGGDGPDTDDLPLLLRRVVEEKQAAQQKKDDENGTERIAGDTIIDNDTLFGLLLPAIADRIQEDTAEGHNRSAFFTLEPIPRYTEEYIKSREHQGAAYFNDRNGLAQFLAKAAPHYQGANSITTPHIERDHLTATSLRALSVDPSIPQGENDGGASLQTAGFESAPGYSGEDAADIFLRVDPILKRLTLQNSLRAADSFSPADFGSIAHSCVEALLNGEEARVPPRLGGHLSITEAAVLLSAGEELAGRFVQSPLGRAAQNAAFRKTEYPFRSLYRDGIFINGTIDLLFEADGTLFVVDFKTDSRENPAEHIPQMACYYRAASDLWKIPCRIYLYYLRTGHAVEMTGAVKDIKFEEIRSARPDLSPPQFPAR